MSDYILYEVRRFWSYAIARSVIRVTRPDDRRAILSLRDEREDINLTEVLKAVVGNHRWLQGVPFRCTGGPNDHLGRVTETYEFYLPNVTRDFRGVGGNSANRFLEDFEAIRRSLPNVWKDNWPYMLRLLTTMTKESGDVPMALTLCELTDKWVSNHVTVTITPQLPRIAVMNPYVSPWRPPEDPAVDPLQRVTFYQGSAPASDTAKKLAEFESEQARLRKKRDDEFRLAMMKKSILDAETRECRAQEVQEAALLTFKKASSELDRARDALSDAGSDLRRLQHEYAKEKARQEAEA